LVNPYTLESEAINVRKAEQQYSEQQIPSSQQPVHLMDGQLVTIKKE
jgi:hypothetical protein